MGSETCVPEIQPNGGYSGESGDRRPARLSLLKFSVASMAIFASRTSPVPLGTYFNLTTKFQLREPVNVLDLVIDFINMDFAVYFQFVSIYYLC